MEIQVLTLIHQPKLNVLQFFHFPWDVGPGLFLHERLSELIIFLCCRRRDTSIIIVQNVSTGDDLQIICLGYIHTTVVTLFWGRKAD